MNDEELWARYFLAGWEQAWTQGKKDELELDRYVNGAASVADAMLKAHRKRFPAKKEGPFR